MTKFSENNLLCNTQDIHNNKRETTRTIRVTHLVYKVTSDIDIAETPTEETEFPYLADIGCETGNCEY